MKFLLNGYLADNFDPSAVDEKMASEIHTFNAELEAAGALFFACGLYPIEHSKTLIAQSDGSIMETDGPYIETKEHVGGLLIIEAANLEEAMVWARKGAKINRMPLEIRPIFFQEE